MSTASSAKPILGLRSPVFVCAAIAIGTMIWFAEWRPDANAFALAVAAFALLVLGVALGETKPLPEWLAQVTTCALAVAYAWFLWLLLGWGERELWTRLICLGAVLAGLGLARNVAVERWRVPLLLLVHAGLGVWTIDTYPKPHIDVWVWHNEALRALFAGKNPYAITMPNIYRHTGAYSLDMVLNGRVLLGFQYPPVSLYLAIPGYLLGDVRYSVLAALLLAGACMAYISPQGFGASALVLWLFSPRCFFFLEHAWTEGYVVLLLALTLVCVVRWPRVAYVPLGLFLVVKQYLVFALPLLWLLPCIDRPHGKAASSHARWQFLLRTAAVGLVATLPFIVINPRAFLDCIVRFQLRQPFRVDALSLPAWWVLHGGQRLPDWLGFASILPMCALALWRCERSASGFAAGLALVSFPFFALSKQAFGNYYFFTLGAVCCSVAFSGLYASEERAPRAG